MAKIVLGIGTSHGPMLSTPPEKWDMRIPDDLRSIHHFRGKTWTFDELKTLRRDENLADQITLDVWKGRHAACRTAIDSLAQAFEAAKPDVAVIVGNDQMEIFDAVIPAFSVLRGPEIVNSMYTDERMAKLPPGIGISVPGHIPPVGATYAGVPELGDHIIRTLMSDTFDVAAMTQLPKRETPHAFGFVYRQIMRDDVIPSVPVVLNTFYPPNQPSVARCMAFGESVVRAIESWDSEARVALIASGGLTHFVIDEKVDAILMDSIRRGDMSGILGLAPEIFEAGTSEVKNWIPVIGAMAALGYTPTVVDYIPCYRSLAGTGNAMGFVYWLPPDTAQQVANG